MHVAIASLQGRGRLDQQILIVWQSWLLSNHFLDTYINGHWTSILPNVLTSLFFLCQSCKLVYSTIPRSLRVDKPPIEEAHAPRFTNEKPHSWSLANIFLHLSAFAGSYTRRYRRLHFLCMPATPHVSQGWQLNLFAWLKYCLICCERKHRWMANRNYAYQMCHLHWSHGTMKTALTIVKHPGHSQYRNHYEFYEH
jgi:hypothetical protein